ncbi:MAG: hypothetical protein AB7O21_00810 [Gammaproteobacteria bacterium]
MIRAGLLLALLPVLAGADAVNEPADPGFASCAAYYFLAARGHGMQDYDRLYSAGEFALNEAIRRHGDPAARARMERVSGTMMDEFGRDWRRIEVLDRHYGAPCERLLRDAEFR